MGFLDALFGRSAAVNDAVRLEANAAHKFAVDEEAVAAFFPWLTSDSSATPSRPGPVSREDALSVPAIKRARDVICGTAAYLPLHVRSSNMTSVDNLFLVQPERQRPRSVTMSMVYEDLFFDNISYWLITERLANGFPRHVEYLEPTRVSETAGKIYVDGATVSPDRIIRFQGMFPARLGKHETATVGRDGILLTGARAIRTLISLDDTAKRYAESPQHLGYFTPKDGVDPVDLLGDTTGLTAAEIEERKNGVIGEMLTAWAQARRSNVTGYVPGSLDYVQTSYDATQIGLKEQRAHAILEIARLTGLDASYLASAPDGKPETYANSEQKRQDLIDLTLAQYLVPVEQRLSMRDVTPQGQTVKYNFDSFLRGDTLTRMQAYAIGVQVGAYTEDEIRDLEDKRPLFDAERAIRDATRVVRNAPRPAITGEVVSND